MRQTIFIPTPYPRRGYAHLQVKRTGGLASGGASLHPGSPVVTLIPTLIPGCNSAVCRENAELFPPSSPFGSDPYPRGSLLRRGPAGGNKGPLSEEAFSK